MSQEELKAAVTQQALDMCNLRIRQNSTVALPGMLASIKAQLEWQVAFFEGRKASERNRLHQLVYGHYAVRELDERDNEFIDALTKAFYVASRTAAGLKVDEKVLNGVP